MAGPTLIYCAHEYTQANGRFAVTVEPENLELESRVRAVARLRRQGEPTIPTTVGLEKATTRFCAR